MRKLNLIIILSLLCLSLALVVATTTLDQHWFCRDMEVTDASNKSKPIYCVEETKKFLNTDPRMIAITNFSNLVKDDKIRLEIKDSTNTVIVEETKTVPAEFDGVSTYYDYAIVDIKGQNRPLGKYPVKIFINDNEVLSDEFEIYEEKPLTCAEQDFYCCPKGKVCVSSEEGECEEGACCTSETQCRPISPGTLTRTLITNCEETGINACGRVIKLYNYSIHGKLEPEQVIVIDFRTMDIDCYKKDDIAIAYYDERNGVWVEKKTFIENVSEDLYNAKAQMNYIGYVALIRTEACVPLVCTYGGYRTIPTGGYVTVEEPITFELCGMVSGCLSLKDDVCNKNCPVGIDLDCKDCTSEAGDCCLISMDKKCDKDCAPYVDPDCCRKSDPLCCAGGSARSDSEECDINCDTGGAECIGCTAASGDCCNANSDGACDLDCPKLPNGVGYLDVDCCAPNSVSITNARGDCCNTAQDGACDCDCITGLDTDCVVSKDCCGNKICVGNENPSNCPSDCSCGDGICSSGGTGGETCSSCPADCGECPPPPPGEPCCSGSD